MKFKISSASFMLITILLVGSFFRLFHLASLPISLFGDEIDVGYHAWSLFATGRDYMGHLFPVYIQSLAESRAPLLMYFSAPIVGLLGPSAFSVRLFPAIMGIFNIYLLYLLTNLLFPQKSFQIKKHSFNLGHLAALSLALTPWHIHFSRAAFEVTLLTSLLLGGTIYFLKKRYVVSFVLFALTFYTYSVANIFTPLLCLGLVIIFPLPVKNFFKASLPAVILCLPLLYQLIFGQVAGRFKLISLANDPKIVEEVVLDRIQPWVTPGLRETIFHNKFTVYLSKFGENYLTSFSPQFLFLHGDPAYRHSVARFGELLWVLAPFVLIGLYFLLQEIKSRSSRIILYWLLISPLASNLTVGGGDHATRLFVMITPLIIISSYGLREFFAVLLFNYRSLFKSLVGGFLALLTIFVFSSYWLYYANHYRFLSANDWGYGYREIFQQLASIQNRFDLIFINNTKQPSLLSYAFYTKLPPKDFQKMFTGDKTVDAVYPEFNGFKFGDKIYFGEAISPFVIDHLTKNNGLYLSAQGREAPGNWNWIKDAPGGTKSLGGVYDVFGQPLFHLITHYQNK